jgi:predicted dehydrogenase
MIKRKILVVGFGKMGCRHVQAFLQNKEMYELHVLELSERNIKDNLKSINASYDECKWYKNLNDIPVLDFAIIATSSEPRFDILKALIKIGFKKFLLEKIVFQSEEQFKIAIKLIKSVDGIAYCNFVSRYFSAYNRIKKSLEANNDEINITVHGGEFGLGCNAIHYLDMFQYLTNDNNVSLKIAKIDVSKTENRRGDYSEFTGCISFINTKSDTISIISEPIKNQGVTINIRSGGESFILNESTEMCFSNTNNIWSFDKFNIIPTSKLSNVIIEDIFNNNCQLTTLEETYKAHLELFKLYNYVLFNKSTAATLCPIT